MVEAYAVNDRMNQLILEQLDPAAWRAQLPGQKGGRTIAAIFAHVHNIRRKWLRLSAPHLRLPVRLDRTRCTQYDARHALAQSAALCCEMLAEALNSLNVEEASGKSVVPDNKKSAAKKFVRDGWATPWQPGPAMFAYMLAHDAHHRGQICMMAHQLGYPLPAKVGAGMWGWEKLRKECGFNSPASKRGQR